MAALQKAAIFFACDGILDESHMKMKVSGLIPPHL
jgi:hypothetical protein